MRWFALVLLWPSLAWAEYQAPVGSYDVTQFTKEASQVISTLEGCAGTGETITCRKASGDFTQGERTALNQVAASHDANTRPRQEQQRRQARVSAVAKLRALGLTAEEVSALFP